MKFSVEWTGEANQTFIHTIGQIREKLTEREVENFIARTEK